MESNVIECIVRKKKVLFPKGVTTNKDGEYAIISFEVVETKKGCPKIDKQWGTIVVKGNMPSIKYAKQYTLVAQEVYEEKYKNYSYEISYICDGNVTFIESKEDIEIVLGQVVGSQDTVKRIMQLDNVVEIFKNKDINALVNVKGVGEKTATKIINNFSMKAQFGVYLAKLGQLGLTDRQIKGMLKKYPNYETVYNKVLENPYISSDNVKGIGFLRADALAKKLGIAQNSVHRVRAYVNFFLNEKAQEGKSFVPTREVLSSLRSYTDETKYPIARELITETFELMKSKDELWWNDNKSILAIPEIREIEKNIAYHLHRLINTKVDNNIDVWKQVVKEIEGENGFEYTDEQIQGIETVLKNNVVVVTGLSGTGKTSVTEPMTRILVRKQNKKLTQVALSGKASQRIQEVTGYEAKTIHRVLEFNPRNEGDGFGKHEKKQIDTDIIILDEASMVDAKLFNCLLRAIRTGTKLVIVGDFGQLSCIGFGQVFLDLLESGIIPVVKLTKIHRQASKSAVITESIKIRNQQYIVNYNEEKQEILGELQDLQLDITTDKDKLLDKTLEYFKERLDIEKNIMEVQVVTTTRTRGQLSVFNINNHIKQMINPLSGFEQCIESRVDEKHTYCISEGDKIIITKNNYQVEIWDEYEERYLKGAIFNGNLGIVQEIGFNYSIIQIEGIGKVRIHSKDYKIIELGYAITCTKSQGSQWNSVIVTVDSSAYVMLSCEWLYTAITRTAKYCVLVGENKAIRRCCSISEVNHKTTFLPSVLREIFDSK